MYIPFPPPAPPPHTHTHKHTHTTPRLDLPPTSIENLMYVHVHRLTNITGNLKTASASYGEQFGKSFNQVLKSYCNTERTYNMESIKKVPLLGNN